MVGERDGRPFARWGNRLHGIFGKVIVKNGMLPARISNPPAGVFDIFKIGLGPSSSHTMGPMTAAAAFAARLLALPHCPIRMRCTLFGSLAWTGVGHATDRAVLLGLSGVTPEHYDPDSGDRIVAQVRADQSVRLGGSNLAVTYVESTDLRWDRTTTPQHPNEMLFEAFSLGDTPLLSISYFSIGGGFVVGPEIATAAISAASQPHPFTSADDLIDRCNRSGLSIAALVLANAAADGGVEQARNRLDGVIGAMESCIDRGLAGEGILPGSLRLPRRARELSARIAARSADKPDSLAALDWLKVWAIAVNEENAAGGRIVTAPTNGAAGIVPAVLRFCRTHHGADLEACRTFLLTAAAFGAICKRNASISGADVGCQGEVGVACAMAAAGLAAVLGGTNLQIENAAEIAIEHNLGLTCDPVAGLVQIPCIERNGMAAVKAVNAARLAMLGNGHHVISFDQAVQAMKQTGSDMSDKYKETSRGGLAVNFTEC